MRKFTGIQKLIRSNFYVYIIVRKFAPFFCRYFNLEDGFAFLSRVKNQDGTIAVDAGSNDGTSIALISKNIGNVPIICVDPVRKPIFSHKLKKYVSYLPIGLGNCSDILNLYVPVAKKGIELTQYASSNKNQALKQIQHDLNLDSNQIHFQEKLVKIRTLDELNLVPFFIKIDVEGYEFKVLAGSEHTIRTYLPIILVEIQNPENYRLISSLLLGFGYRNYVPASLSGKSWKELKIQTAFSPIFNNYLWLPLKNSPSWDYK